MEKIASRGGNYVGSLLQLFDWNAKSRKKFLTNSEFPEQSKQKKRYNGYSPMAQLQTLNEDESAAGSSIKESSDFSCPSSVTDEDFYGPRAPGVVARLMGLESLPESSNISKPSPTPYITSQSPCVADYETKNLGYRQDTEISVQNSTEPKNQEMNRPIKKFQTEVLPPKSAKSIPITHHRLLSPVKSMNFIPSKSAAHIMEAAAKIIEPGPQVKKKTKFPPVGSSSLPLRVQDLKEKAQGVQKQSNLSKGSQRSGESYSSKNMRGNSMNKSWKRSVDGTFTGVFRDSEESSVGVKNRGKSISLALQAKANVQKREGLALSGSRNLAIQKETSEVNPNQLLKSQSMRHKSTLKKPSMSNGSSVLRQNNRKQNCIADKGKLSLASKAGGENKPSGDVSSARQSNSCQLSGTSKFSSRKLGSKNTVDKREISSSISESVAHKKLSVDGNYLSGKNQDAHNIRIDKNRKVIQSSAIVEGQSSWNQDGGKTGTDVISFTFNTPMTRLGALSGSSSEKRGNCEIISGNSLSKRTPLNSDGTIASTLSILGHDVKGGDPLSTVLEKQLKELAHKIDFSPHKSGSLLHDAASGLDAFMSSTVQEENNIKDGMHTNNQGVLEEIGKCGSDDISEDRKLVDCQLLSPVSVLERSSFADTCHSSDTTDSNSTEGSKQCSSIDVQEVRGMHTLKMLGSVEGDNTELSDSASSTSFERKGKRRETTLVLVNCEKPRLLWELEYVKEMLCNIELMFIDYALGHACEIIDPRLFEQLESWTGCLNGRGLVQRLDQLVLFDCVSEYLDLRCRRYVGGGCKLWAKGVSVITRKERLAEEVYKEISSWGAIGDTDVDQLVYKDMSGQQGRWLDFEIEAFELGVQIESCVLESLVDEVITDIWIT